MMANNDQGGDAVTRKRRCLGTGLSGIIEAQLTEISAAHDTVKGLMNLQS